MCSRRRPLHAGAASRQPSQRKSGQASSLGLLQVLGVDHREDGAVAVQQLREVGGAVTLPLLNRPAHAARVKAGQVGGWSAGDLAWRGGERQLASGRSRVGIAAGCCTWSHTSQTKAPPAAVPHRREKRWVSRRSSNGSTPQRSWSALAPRLARLRREAGVSKGAGVSTAGHARLLPHRHRQQLARPCRAKGSSRRHLPKQVQGPSESTTTAPACSPPAGGRPFWASLP